MNSLIQKSHREQFLARLQFLTLVALTLVAICFLIPDSALAATSAATTGAAGTAVKTKVEAFTCDILNAVRVAGWAIVTIAVFVFGYQVGFGGKRPTEAAPILVGGILIGIASEVANFVVGTTGGASTC